MNIGIIAGTGMDWLTPLEGWPGVKTPYGPAHIGAVEIGGRRVAVLRRHGPGLNVPPHLINYRANLWALREAGVRRVLATAAVGSMKKDMEPGTLAVMHDFVDFTRRRVGTMFDETGEAVVHMDFSIPYCPEISSSLEQAAEDQGIAMGRRVVYVCVDGPRYETPAEIRGYANWGDVVGMTGVPEVVLARELGMCYGALAVLTNYAAGVADKCLSHEEVVACMLECHQMVHDVFSLSVTKIPDSPGCNCIG